MLLVRRNSCGGRRTACGGETTQQAEAMLLQKGVESVLFQGRALAGETNAEKLERFARDLAKEHARHKQRAATSPGPSAGPPPPAAVIEQQATTVTEAAAGRR
jgi:hypothetical protein